MIEIQHVAIANKPDSERGYSEDTVFYMGATLKDAIKSLNETFIKMKSSGKNVVRVTISNFIEYQKEK